MIHSAVNMQILYSKWNAIHELILSMQFAYTYNSQSLDQFILFVCLFVTEEILYSIMAVSDQES